MSRNVLLALGAAIALLGLAALYLWLGGGGGSIALPRLGAGAGAVASAAMAGLLAGFVGAAIANRFNIGRRGHDAGLAQRIAALETARDSARAASPPPPPPPPVAAERAAPQPAARPSFIYDRPRQEPQARQEPVAPPPPEPAEARGPAPPPPPEPAEAREPPPPPEPRRRPSVPNLAEISAAYSRIVSGHISRSAFAQFFDGIGRSVPVEITDGGNAIGRASGESFLTCVDAGEAYLVFPSYDFIANQTTQFATVASVPESIAAVFTLERGDGELILDRPAIYEDSGTGLRRVEKGEIRGFGG